MYCPVRGFPLKSTRQTYGSEKQRRRWERRKSPETRRREGRKHEIKKKCKTTRDGDGVAKQCLMLRLEVCYVETSAFSDVPARSRRRGLADPLNWGTDHPLFPHTKPTVRRGEPIAIQRIVLGRTPGGSSRRVERKWVRRQRKEPLDGQ